MAIPPTIPLTPTTLTLFGLWTGIQVTTLVSAIRATARAEALDRALLRLGERARRIRVYDGLVPTIVAPAFHAPPARAGLGRAEARCSDREPAGA